MASDNSQVCDLYSVGQHLGSAPAGWLSPVSVGSCRTVRHVCVWLLVVTWAESSGCFMWSGILEQAGWAFSVGGCRGLRGTHHLPHILFAKSYCKSSPDSRDNKEKPRNSFYFLMKHHEGRVAFFLQVTYYIQRKTKQRTIWPVKQWTVTMGVWATALIIWEVK